MSLMARLPDPVHTSSDEVYLIDARDLRIVHVGHSACARLCRERETLLGTAFPALTTSPVTVARKLHAFARTARRDKDSMTLSLRLQRQDGEKYPTLLGVHVCHVGDTPCILCIGKPDGDADILPEESPLTPSTARVDHRTTWLVYTLLQRSNGKLLFPYLSSGCENLLGIKPQVLQSDPSLFFNLIIPQDQDSYIESMTHSIISMSSWHWEGRIWVEPTKRIEWINLQATPHPLKNNTIRWDGIMTNITRNKDQEEEIKVSRARLAELSAHIEEVKEQEREQLSREIHDDLGGNLTAIKMTLALLIKHLPQSRPDLTEKSKYVDQLVDRTIEATHRIASNMRPGILDFGIVDALEWQANEFARQSGIACSFVSDAPEIQLQTEYSTALFRIAQEALTNIAKHAGATRVSIRISADKTHVQLRISDNGKGITEEDVRKPQSFGIRGMMERARSLGGKLSFDLERHEENTIVVIIPLTDMFFDTETSLSGKRRMSAH
jgi:signal transduction histidine kinase